MDAAPQLLAGNTAISKKDLSVVEITVSAGQIPNVELCRNLSLRLRQYAKSDFRNVCRRWGTRELALAKWDARFVSIAGAWIVSENSCHRN
jgi:hypothetical protein